MQNFWFSYQNILRNEILKKIIFRFLEKFLEFYTSF